jgi:hypothetical protein
MRGHSSQEILVDLAEILRAYVDELKEDPYEFFSYAKYVIDLVLNVQSLS